MKHLLPWGFRRFGEGVVEDGGNFFGWKGDWFLITPAAISSIDTQNE